MANVLLGADPEVFVKDAATGEFISAHTLDRVVRGTKERPEMVDCGAIQIDGTALEFNIDPTDCEEEWVNNLKTVMDALRERLPEGLVFAEEVTATFEPTYFKMGIPDEAKQIGCDPDFDFHRPGEARFFRPQVRPQRMAGGHIHVSKGIGYLPRMDWYVGLGSLLFDTDKVRRRTYGGPSAYRNKPYGYEYRTPSNAWIMSEERQRWAFRMTQRAHLTNSGPSIQYPWGERVQPDSALVRRCINTGILDTSLLPEDMEYVR